MNVSGVDTQFIIDTGSDCNIVGKSTWENMKTQPFRMTRQEKGGPNIYAYTSQAPMQILGQFWAEVRSHDQILNDVRFVVIASDAEPLLGIEIVQALNLVNFTNLASADYGVRFPRLFSGSVGKADHEIKLSIRKDVTPVAQSFRRTPFAMMKKLEKHLEELVESDIIEKVNGPTSWVSPVVIVPKANDKIRLCVDMRRPNAAIIRHHYPVPTVDELLRDMNGAQFSSKLDMRLGFHQFVLSPESRDITTFNTHVGLYRYKRLMFGINAAPEIYQREVSNIIQGITGVANLADDIVVVGKTQVEHDQRLLEVLARLEAAGMTLNREKCVFSARSIDFLGHRISGEGIDPGANKVKAISEAVVPQTVGELKSFLGLVGYCSKFIPSSQTRLNLYEG